MQGTQGILIVVLMIGVMYVTMIRPQQKRLRQHQQLVSAIRPGDEIVTIGGMYGIVRALNDEDSTVIIEADGGGRMKFSRQAISRRVNEPVEDEVQADEAEPSTDDR